MKIAVCLSGLALILAAGCGGQPPAVTDPNQLPPLTEEQVRVVRDDDRRVADEEHANPVQPRRGSKAGR